MDKPIQVGDLVVVVKWPCCGVRLGMTGEVADIFTEPNEIRVCYECKAVIANKGDIMARSTHPSNSGRYVRAPLAWLRRIPPLSELEGERTEEKLKEPA